MFKFDSTELVFASIAITVLFLVFSSGFIILVLWLQKRKQQHQAKLLELNIHSERMKLEFEQELLQTKIEIQEHTLKNISQEIHDNIGQALTLAKLNLNTLQPGEDEKINVTLQLISKSINDLRDLSRSMHGEKITELGLVQSITNELKILQNSGEYQTDLRIIGNVYPLENGKEIVLFRIVQEAIHNAIKHAKTKKLEVHLDYSTDNLRLLIQDFGKGFDHSEIDVLTPGIGLRNMNNRASLIGGKFSICSVPESGTTVTITL